MNYEFLSSSIDKDNIILPNSDKINSFLLKNNHAEILKAVDFLASEEKFLYLHGFMGTGKRQFVNYIGDFLNKNVIKLEYYCKEATVCDDILLNFSEYIDNHAISKAVNLNAKITTLAVKFKQQIASIKKPFLIILHSFDDVQQENTELIKEVFNDVLKEENVKFILSTRALLADLNEDRKIFLKALAKDVFKEFLEFNNVVAAKKTIEDFYKYTRGYYYYTALSVKIMQAMNIDLNEFLQKYNQSEMNFDSFLGMTYVNLVPTAIRNFFWFLRTVRHGLTLNALAVYEIYDEFSIEYLKSNLMIFQADETLYVQDYFLQKIDISIPKKTQIKLHKYIIGIYEGLLKAQIKERAIIISRQALRAEIEYHNKCITELDNSDVVSQEVKAEEQVVSEEQSAQVEAPLPIAKQIEQAQALANDKKYTDAIEIFNKILNIEEIDLPSLIEVRLNLAKLYKTIADYKKSTHYYELVETYYLQHKEFINLNYLYYDMTDLFFRMYKSERAIETIKKVIYSVDTPQSLLVSACTLLGNIYSEMNNSVEAYSYYKKALESLDENVSKETLAELYFKFALASDDRDEIELALEYYNKCIAVNVVNPYKALSYSNLASCYYENGSLDDAKACFKRAYELEKKNNNYEGIYYNASNLAKIYMETLSSKALNLLIEAKKCAEFINEEFYILESAIALGDYYYNNPKTYKEALIEYYKALSIAEHISGEVDSSKISQRIKDMELRMTPEEYTEIENKYDKRN